MTDLERFFRRLVANLAASDPARLHRPIPLEDIHESIVPYRSNRRALLLDSSEDYELVLLRLCAGEGGLVRTEPEEVRARFAEEAGAPTPTCTCSTSSSTCWSRSARSRWPARSTRSPTRPAVRAALRDPAAGRPRPAGARPAQRSRPDRAATPPRRPTRRTNADGRGAALPLLRRLAARRPAGSLLPALRAAAGAIRVPPVPQRCRARLAPLRELRSRAGRRLAHVRAPGADTPLR